MKLEPLRPEFKPEPLKGNRIVSVKILERHGNTAEVEINGKKVSAKVSEETPDQFLALVEPGDKNDAPGSINLRVLSSANKSPEYQAALLNGVSEDLKSLLFEMHLPLTKEFLEAGLKLYDKGIRIDSTVLKLLVWVKSKMGSGYSDLMLNLLAKGMPPDRETAEFMFKIRQWALLFPEKEGGISGKPEDIPMSAASSNGETVLESFMQTLLGSNYRSALTEYQGEKYLVQQRKVRNQTERFYFDISGPELGSVLIMADITENETGICLFLEEGLLKRFQEKKGQKELGSRLVKITPGKPISFRVEKYIDLSRFYRDDAKTFPDRLTKLDISV